MRDDLGIPDLLNLKICFEAHDPTDDLGRAYVEDSGLSLEGATPIIDILHGHLGRDLSSIMLRRVAYDDVAGHLSITRATYKTKTGFTIGGDGPVITLPRQYIGVACVGDDIRIPDLVDIEVSLESDGPIADLFGAFVNDHTSGLKTRTPVTTFCNGSICARGT
jgi:hypothetical protein